MANQGWVIIKKSRSYQGGPGYNGPTSVRARVRGGLVYRLKRDAQAVADKLSKINLIGFEVLPYRPLEICPFCDERLVDKESGQVSGRRVRKRGKKTT